MSVGKMVARRLAPVARQMTPRAAVSMFRSVLDAAIDGRRGFPGAVAVAERQLGRAGGDGVRAANEVIEQHVRLAGAQGFVTSLGGFAVMAVTLPANITGLAVLQARMVAAIAHVRGYDLSDPRVRTAVVTCMLGEDAVDELLGKGVLPSTPLGIATAPVHDETLDGRIATELGTILTAQVGGKRLSLTVSRRIPLLGGGVGAVVDGVATYRVGRYAQGQLPPRRPDQVLQEE
jgi:EcsC protein family